MDPFWETQFYPGFALNRADARTTLSSRSKQKIWKYKASLIFIKTIVGFSFKLSDATISNSY